MSAAQERSRPQPPAHSARIDAIEPRLLEMLVRRGDLILAALLVAVIALLLIPLPTGLLDALIADGAAIEVLYVHGHWRGVNDLEDLRSAVDFAHAQRPFDR